MKTNIIDDIWEIRGQIDNAIALKDMNLFNIAKEKFVNIYQNKKHLNSWSTATAGKLYESDEEFDYDRETNFAMLAYDLDRSRKEVLNDNTVFPKAIQFSSPLEVLWYTRDMFDTYFYSVAAGNADEGELKNLITAVKINIEEICESYKYINDKTSIKERISLQVIKKQIENEYNTFCCNDAEI